MREFDQQQLMDLIGDKIPGGAVPAVWWITVDPDQIAAYDRWWSDYEAHVEKVDALARTLGLTSQDARLQSWGGRSTLVGFDAPMAMEYWSGHPQHQPVPHGWRHDKKVGRLIPSRKTKADRESQANKDFAAIKKVPDVQAYVTGLPMEIYLDDRDMGGTIYRVNYRRGAKCVWAYCGGDPDRSPDKRQNGEVNEEIWHRQKLSLLIALREAREEASRILEGELS